jgi:hypothetical protein
MGKLKLDLTALKVDSFDTGDRGALSDGTVFGQSGADESCFSWGSCNTTCAGVPETCGGTDPCTASDFGTWCVTGCQQCPC